MSVLLCGEFSLDELRRLLSPYGLYIEQVSPDQPIAGSHFGEPEAGLIGNRLIVRNDTPVHSALHEACHYICMDSARRSTLHADAGGGYEEENGVCYLQILLARRLPGYGAAWILRDMDEWGYSFRLGSARAWFEQDADDAREWLVAHGVLTSSGDITGRCVA